MTDVMRYFVPKMYTTADRLRRAYSVSQAFQLSFCGRLRRGVGYARALAHRECQCPLS